MLHYVIAATWTLLAFCNAFIFWLDMGVKSEYVGRALWLLALTMNGVRFVLCAVAATCAMRRALKSNL